MLYCLFKALWSESVQDHTHENKYELSLAWLELYGYSAVQWKQLTFPKLTVRPSLKLTVQPLWRKTYR